MEEWTKQGGNVAVFPEGQFSWDGKPGPFLPGLSQLVNYLKLPVVCVHVSNGDRIKPKWANFYRKTSIDITIHPTIKFERGDDIEKMISEKIFLNHSQLYESSGKNLAKGLAKNIRFCPNCSSDNTLIDEGDDLSCSVCNEVWKLDANNNISGKAINSISDLFESTKRNTELVWEREKNIKTLNKVVLLDISQKSWVFECANILELNEKSLKIGDFKLNYDEILSFTNEWGDIIILRTRKKRLGIKLDHDSRAVVENILERVFDVRGKGVNN